MLEVPENVLLRAEFADKSDDELTTILQDLKPDLHNTSDLLERSRTIRAIEIARFEREHANQQEPLPDIHPLTIGIRWDRSELHRRITERLKMRLENGMIEEVRRLHEGGVAWERLDYYGLEYRYIGAFLQGKLNRNDMFQKLNSAIHDFAKRQENWFKKMEKNGVTINWVGGAGDPLSEARNIILHC